MKANDKAMFVNAKILIINKSFRPTWVNYDGM